MIQRAYTEATFPEDKVVSTSLHDRTASIEYIYHHLFPPLRALAYRIVRSNPDSEDIIMTVIFKTLRSRTQPKSYDHLRRRLHVAVKNEAITWLRYRNKHQKVIADFFNTIDRTTHTVTHPSIRDKETICINVSKKIAELPPQQQKVLNLYFRSGKTTQQIAIELRIKPQTVLNHKKKALDFLRNSELQDEWRAMFES